MAGKILLFPWVDLYNRRGTVTGGEVISFPGHKWFRCNCNSSTCMFCEGGLGACVTCGGAEGDLPRDCPQTRCEGVVLSAVYAGEIDYDRGRGWYRKERIDVRQG